jgi:hypothetical protein
LSAISASSVGPINRSAIQSGLRTLASGSRDPRARAAAVRIAVRDGRLLASIPGIIEHPRRCRHRRSFSPRLRGFRLQAEDLELTLASDDID